jgi:hypothetical protein
MRTFTISLLIALSFSLFAKSTFKKAKVTATSAQVILYPAPAGMAASPDYSVTVNGQQAFVYTTKVRTCVHRPVRAMGMSYFDCNESASVTVNANVSMENAVIRPKSYGIKPVINGKSLTFTLRKNQKVTIEPNGYDYDAIAIFANALDANPPQENDPNVIYYGPGIHNVGVVKLSSNKTVYLAGGSVVRGRFDASGVNNLKILGHGMIDHSQDTIESRFIRLHKCSNVVVDGPILFDGWGGAFNSLTCNNVSISDVKLVGKSADGISMDACKNYLVENCFIRNHDDAIVVKSKYGVGDVRGITVRNCIIWSDRAQALEIGFELQTALVDSISFKNIDIIHAYGNNAISIHNGSQAVVCDILFEDIRIEDLDATYCKPVSTPSTYILLLEIGKSKWSKTGGQGNIQNIYFKNLCVTTKPGSQFPVSSFVGYDADHTVDTVTFENFTIDGKVIKNITDGNIEVKSTDFVKNITFLNTNKK